ncbi:MAG: AAA family ATPase [Clostridiales Family XIII bacterium]|jgi:predicted ATPase|nr:AAA family ATPase [Clostridiales Family XIII bacterium]
MENIIFQNGAAWLRVDFHLHTKADNEFSYSEDVNSYIAKYVNALVKANIRVGVITNHNKFDVEEFRALRGAAKKQGVFLLPGVELSVGDGDGGIHTLVVFSGEWANEDDYINSFLSVAFQGKTPSKYQNNNGRSSQGLNDTIKLLEGYHKDFFLISHENNEKCRMKVKQWLGDWYPAELEGSDPKSIEEIGKGRSSYIKLGSFTFEAVKFALLDYENRLRSNEAPKYTHSHIKQIYFDGGALNGRTIHFSPELNTFIGIRGSGKSSVLEVLRYALGIQVEASDNDHEYKQRLVERALNSGGKVILDIIDRHGHLYQLERIWKELPSVFINRTLQPGVSIRETVLNKPLFFGQKELAIAGKDSENALIEKLLGSKCDEIRLEITKQTNKVIDVIDRLSKISNVDELIDEQTKIKQDTEFRLNFYKEHNLEEKLQKRLGFESDVRRAGKGVDLIESFIADIRASLAVHEDELRNFPGYISSNNVDFFMNFDSLFAEIIQSVESINAEADKSQLILNELKNEREKLLAMQSELTDEFAAVERGLATELKTSHGQNISADEFLVSKRKLAAAEATLAALLKSKDQKTAIQNELSEATQKLNDLWHKEFQIIQTELDNVSRRNTALKFAVGFKDDKPAFCDYFKSIFKGSNTRDITFKNITDKYQDFISIYSDFAKAKELFGSKPDSFANIFEQNLKSLLPYKTPNRFTITYHGIALVNHSLGQRASALILFVLGRQENDVIIIDQPEDDLDNQTIYEDVIKMIRELKPHVQFIFATHNPNIPVLGDAEQIHACSFSDDTISIDSGGLDEPTQQKNIVDIMEGGKEAFERRKEIYQIWRS